MKIAVIVGSLRRESYNKTLARVLVAKLPSGIEAEYIDLADVPLMNEDLESAVPVAVAAAASQVAESDGVLIVSPEYNRGIPAVTKNIIDWLSRPSTGNPLASKPVAVAGVSSGPIKTLVMQSQLRPVLAHTGAIVMTGPVVGLTIGDDAMTKDGELSERTEEVVEKFIGAFLKHTSLYMEGR